MVGSGTSSNPDEEPLGRSGGLAFWDILTIPDAVSSADAAEAVKRDVLRNIRHVLNTRRGRCIGHADYGMPDVAEFFVSPSVESRLAREIKRVIERWEPRVRSPVEVRVVSSMTAQERLSEKGLLQVAFLVRSRLKAPFNELCTFRTMILADGQAEVKP